MDYLSPYPRFRSSIITRRNPALKKAGAAKERGELGAISMGNPDDQPYFEVPFSAELVHLDGNALIALAGELDMATAPDLYSALEPLIENGPAELVLDLSGLSFIDSSGLAVLVNAQKRLHDQARNLSIRSPRPNALRVFEVSGLMDVLNVAGDREPSED